MQHWFQATGELVLGELPIPSERFLSFLGGHPLAAKVARLWAEHPSQELVDDISIFKELRDTIVTFILAKLKTSQPETELLSFASIFRLPAPREVFTRWRGEEANFLLNSLTGQYLIESSEKGYQLHPLVRDFYYSAISPKRAIEFHKIAGKYYIDTFESVRKATKDLNPETLWEAIHNFLAAGDKRRVQDLAFYRQELRLHIRQHSFEVSDAVRQILHFSEAELHSPKLLRYHTEAVCKPHLERRMQLLVHGLAHLLEFFVIALVQLVESRFNDLPQCILLTFIRSREFLNLSG